MSSKVENGQKNVNKHQLEGKRAKQVMFLTLYKKNLFCITRAAREMGIHRRRVYDWLKDPWFESEMDCAREEMKDEVQHSLI